MNVETTTKVVPEEQRLWLLDYKDSMGLSWAEVSKRAGVPSGTISQFGSGKYQGDKAAIALKVMQFREHLAHRVTLEAAAPDVPVFYETETGDQLTTMLTWAHRGQLVAAGLEAGLGKTKNARRYRESYTNVFYVELRKSAGSIYNMLQLVLKALGEAKPTGSPLKMSEQICEILGKYDNPLLILDEAQHLSEGALDEARSWFDTGKTGLALFGNYGVLQRLQRYPQLYSRITMKLSRNLPLRGDIDAMLDAWAIFEEPLRVFLRDVCMKLGGLRNGTSVLQLAWVIAASSGEVLSLGHLQDAWAQLSSRVVSA